MSEIILIEISALQYISALKNLLSFQFRFSTEYEPGSIQALFLFSNGFSFRFVFCSQRFFSSRQVADSSIQFLDTDVLGSQFSLKFFDTLLFSVQFSSQSAKEWQIPLTPLPKTYPATAAFLELMVTLDELFDEFPAVLRLPEGTALTLLYRDVVYSDQDILNSVGGLACHISETCSLTFYGTTEHRETAEMTVRPGSSPKKGRVLTRSLSGRPIRRLQGLGVRLDLGDRDAADHLTVMARALAASGGPWGVVSRQHEAFVHKCGLLQPTQGSLFSYFAWENARPQQLLTALTAEHKALLWESFLADGQQPLEFAWLWEIYYTDQTRWLLEWELALDMVLDQLSFQVNRDTNSFCLLDGTGRERRFDFTRGGPAEKLFLKLLFPLDTR